MGAVMEINPMAVGDVYEVTDRQEFQGQEVLNVYFYQQQAAFVPLEGTIAQALADEWAETILPVITEVQSNELLHVQVDVRNLFDDLDNGTAITAAPGTGSVDADSLAAFNAWGLTLQHDNAAVRPGSKRIAGVFENAQDDGAPTPTTVTALNTLGDALAAPITGGLIIEDDIMFPVVVKRVREGVDPDFTYRLPENSGELVFGLVLETLVNLFVTSQISRKRGVGA